MKSKSNFKGYIPHPLATITTLFTMLAPAAVSAQESASRQQVIEEVVVTGSLVVRDGFQSPTPVTVTSREEIDNFAPSNVADYLSTLPIFAGNSTPQNSRRAVSAGGAGLNSLNLRSLGTTRTLVLLDGQRVVPSQPTGQVDINPFPQQLIQRVDIVTGGASAVYGSDAVSGVVNFILDRRFTGFKGEAVYGQTNESDNQQRKIAASMGTPFADQRGHFLLSGEFSEVDGTDNCLRGWCTKGWYLINNPDYASGTGLPERIVVDQAAVSNMTAGGLITTGPLRGTAFGPGGTPYQFNYGPLNNNSYMQGGDWQENNVHQYTSLNPEAKRYNVFSRASFELTPNLEVFAQLSYGRNESLTSSGVMFNPGNLTVQADNAFIPDSVRAAMADQDLTTLRIGTFNRDIGSTQSDNMVELLRYVVGADGTFNAFNSDWDWNVYYQYGETTNTKSFYDRIRTPFLNAIDSVVDPATSQIVCRSTLTDPDNGCVPWNVFGTGVNSDEARDYVAAWSFAEETNKQEVFAARIAGTPFSIPAGGVSVAAGLERRRESGGGVESEINQNNQSWLGNQAPTFGSYSVTEGFVEAVIPLLSSMPTELNTAARVTDYSTSGTVTTWKAGITFAPHDDLTLRTTRSRDIRAPNRRELFAAGVFTGSSVIDPFRDNALGDIQSLLSGNPNLKPEVADTTGIGLVYQPSFIDGLSASIDYFNIEIKDAIGTVPRQEVVDRCFRGEQAFCDATSRNADGIINVVAIQPTNFVSQLARGVDLEVSYRAPLGNGELGVRGLMTRYIKASQDTGSAPPTDAVGSNFAGPPTYRYTVSLSYRIDKLTASLTGRGLSSGVYNTTNIQCISACPDSNSFNRTVNDNQMPSAFYLDLAVNYLLPPLFGQESTVFLAVQNLMNKDPGVMARGPGGNPSDPPSNPTYYDIMGREYRMGLRIGF